MKKAIKVISVLLLIIILLTGVTVGGGYYLTDSKVKVNAGYFALNSVKNSVGDDKIHFINVGSTDCIIIESNGKFGMIDASEDNEYPANKPNLKLLGYENVVLDYLKKNCSDENGKVTLEFILGTHSHSGNIGGFDTVVNDKDVTVKYGYLKQYNENIITQNEINELDNQVVYNQMMKAMTDNNVEIIQDLEDLEFTLGDFTIEVFNGENESKKTDIGENDNSLVCKVTKGERSALLTGDFDNLTGDETAMAKEFGKIDLLKVGHHGYDGSSSLNFVKTINPKISICTNSVKKMSPIVKFNLAVMANSAIYGTVDENGIIAEFSDSNKIELYKDIM